MKIVQRKIGPQDIAINIQTHDCNIVELSTIPPKAVEFLVGPIPLGKLVLIGGVPASGKTTISLSLAAMITTGGCWPFTSQRAKVGKVIIVTCEDDAADTVVPRLIAAGADRGKAILFESVMEYEDDVTKDAAISISRHIHHIDGLLTSQPETRAVIFDPLSAYLGAKDSHRDADVRQVLGPLCELAAKHRVTIIGITHLNKNEGISAMARFMGSTGIIAASRAAFLAVMHEDQLMFLPVKSNLAPLCKGLTYEIRTKIVAGDIEASYIEWTGETDIRPDEILATAKRISNAPRLMDATEFLKTQLQFGPKLQKHIKEAADRGDVAWATVRRAKEDLQIQSTKEEFSGKWKWYTVEQHALKTRANEHLRKH